MTSNQRKGKTQFVLWTAKLFVAGLICVSTTPNTKAAEVAESGSSTTNAIVLEADAKAAGRPLIHFWSRCVGAGRANEGLRAGWLEQLKLVHDQCGFQYVRFHGLFHSDMFVYHETTKGVPVYNWQYIDDLFDRMLAIGVRPFVEFGFNPIDPLGGVTNISADTISWVGGFGFLVPNSAPAPGASGKSRPGQFWWQGNARPPGDLNKWSELIKQFTVHCEERYGITEVRRWYFEVWNEPNLQPFFRGGTQRQYFELYKASALAVKNVDPSLRVGGPATSNFQVRDLGSDAGGGHGVKKAGATPDDAEALDWQPVWVEEFIAYCHDNHLPLDFISTHPYPTSFPFDDGSGKISSIRRTVDATRHDLQLLRQIVDGSSYPKAEIQLTEWSSSPSSRDFTHDSLPAAAFVVKANIESRGLVDSLSYWTFTDVFEEGGAGNTIFHGGFGLVNYQGIVKPTFHAYRFLHALGDETLAAGDGVIVTRHHDSGRITALIYHYPPEVKISLPNSRQRDTADEMETHGIPRPVMIRFTRLKPRARVRVETLDKNHGYALAAWKAMGSPEPPTRRQAAELRKAAIATKIEFVRANRFGRLILRRSIEPWSIVLIAEQ